MEIKDFYNQEPMRYWTPAKDKHIELDIIEHPEKYSDYLATKKRDGEWTRWIVDPNHEVTVQSRTISKVTGTFGHKTEQLPQLVDVMKELPANTVVLGEVCFFNDLSKHSKDVGSITRCLASKAIARQKDNPLHLYIFDILMWNGESLIDTPYSERITYFSNVRRYVTSQLVHLAHPKEVTEIAKQYDDYLACGGEGYVLIKKNSLYVPGTRTAWNSIKLKKATEEIILPVISAVEPEKEYRGKEESTWQYWIDGQPVTKRYFNGMKNGVVVQLGSTLISVTSGTTDEDAIWLASQDAMNQIVNRQLYAVVQAMEIEQDSGSLRHPCLVRLLKKGEY